MYSTTQDEVEWHDSVIYYSIHARKNVIYLFYTIKIQMVYHLKDLGGMKKEKQVC